MPSKRQRDAHKRALSRLAQRRGDARRTRAQCAEQTEAMVRRILAERRGPQWVIEQVMAKNLGSGGGPQHVSRFRQLCEVMAELAPRLMIADYVQAAFCLASVPWVRPVEEWIPRSKARDAQFRSLCEHLLGLYPMPAFLWSVFTERDATAFAPLVAELGRGASLHRMVGCGAMPVPLSKRQCHDVLQAHGDCSLVRAIRKVQVISEGGNERLLWAWLRTPPGRRIDERTAEEFWLTVLRLFARASMLDAAHVGPLVDYIAQRRRDDAGFSMKGRTIGALMRGMHQWHRELHQARVFQRFRYPEKFEPSGFKDGTYDQSKRDKRTAQLVRMVWRIREILTSAALQQEGKEQRHCVYSYGASIVNGTTSIWSMTLDQYGKPQRVLTIEVRNRERSIMQVRGWSNRLPTNQEHQVLAQWASANRLVLQGHG